MDVADAVEAKWSALNCHRTQFGPGNLFRRLPEPTVKEMMRREYFALAWPEPGPGRASMTCSPVCEVSRAKEISSRMQDHNTPAIRVVGLSGSLRDGSYTRLAVQVALRGAAELGAETCLLDLRDYELMFSTGRVDEATCPPDVLRLRRDSRAAQGIILGTPEYHASFSGVLKTVLD